MTGRAGLLFHLIGEAVKADPLRGKRFLDEGRMTGYLPQKEGSERFNNFAIIDFFLCGLS
jgi:hypothetical protein